MTNTKGLVFFYILFAGALLPWLYFQTHIYVNADAYWLTMSARHLMAGSAMTDRVFDTNPPLCFLIYAPAALLYDFGISIWNAITIYTATLILLCAVTIKHQLKYWSVSPCLAEYMIILMVIFLTVLSLHQFGQKDHLIGIILPALTLIQIGITNRKGVPEKFNIPLLILYAPIVMAKPHYTLIPALIILHRLITWKSIKALLQSDVIIFGVTGIIYTLFMVFYFTDYFEIILPLVGALYLQTSFVENIHQYAFSFVFVAGALWVFSHFSEAQKDEKTINTALIFGMIFSILSYWVQMKGFSYHMVPFLSYAACIIGAVLALYIPPKRALVGLYTVAILLAPFTLVLFQTMKDNDITDYASKYQGGPVHEILVKNSNSRAFYVENNSTHNVMQFAAHNGMTYASRFPQNWFTYDLKLLPEEQYAYYRDLLGRAIAEDIERDKPGAVLLLKTERTATMLDVFSGHEEFENALDHYKKGETISTKELFFRPKESLGLDEVEYIVYRHISQE